MKETRFSHVSGHVLFVQVEGVTENVRQCFLIRANVVLIGFIMKTTCVAVSSSTIMQHRTSMTHSYRLDSNAVIKTVDHCSDHQFFYITADQ